MMHYTLRLTGALIALLLTACESVPEQVVEKAPAPTYTPIESKPQPVFKPKAIVKQPTATPIISPKKSDIIFAQTSLKALGYPVGKVDGAWGKRSASAMQLFEKNQNIQSANGKLSNLNLAKLQNTHIPLKAKTRSQPKVVKSSLQNQPQLLDQKEVVNNEETQSNIANKLSSTAPNRHSPELIIVDQGYSVLVKPNPYSARVTEIEAGTGVYILSHQSDWYEVETLNNQHGYIRDSIAGN